MDLVDAALGGGGSPKTSRMRSAEHGSFSVDDVYGCSDQSRLKNALNHGDALHALMTPVLLVLCLVFQH